MQSRSGSLRSFVGPVSWVAALMLMLTQHAAAQPIRFMNWWSGAQGEALAKVIDALQNVQDESDSTTTLCQVWAALTKSKRP